MATQVESLIVGLDADTAKYNTKMKGVEATNAKVNKSVSGIGRSAGMAGIQLQQFVGQVQGGQSVMLALSQQSADLGFVLGAPLLGAITGIAASLAGILLPSLFSTNEEIKNLESNTESLIKKFTTLTEKQKEVAIAGLQEDLKKQTDQFAKLTVEAKELEQELSNSKYLSRQGGILNFFSDIEGDSEALASTNTALATTEIKIQKIANQLINLSKGDVESATGSPKDNSADEERRDVELKALADHFIRQSAIKEQLETEENESRLEREQAFIDAVNEIKFTGLETEQELFFKQQEIHQALLDQKLISEEDYAKAQEKISKKYAKTLKTEEKQVKSSESSKLATRQNAVRLGMAVNAQLFGDNKAIAAGLIVADTAVGIQKSLAVNPYDYVNVGIIAATGALNLANALSSSPGGGSISSPSGGAAPKQQEFSPETSSLDVTEFSEGGTKQIEVILKTEDGRTLAQMVGDELDEISRNGG